MTYSQFSKELNVKASQGTNLKNVFIYNVLGQRILAKTNLNNNEANIVLTSVEKQSYIILVESSKGVFTKKIMINSL
ncbi:T9SS type A sorting domain-containing protein [Mangrovimonas sp. TPBH4]|uniref:T9SS type A sorting domain-containing protein n=1 Tax=Mangrovimonas sp. TPBH4 TaxID=1645914 RepID=UPI0009E82692